MKYIVSLFIFISFLFLSSFSSFCQIISTSPINDTKNHNPEASIILKLDSPTSLSEVNTWDIIIEGTKSGLLHTNYKLSSDQKTIIINPESDFLFNETVYVRINPNQKNNKNQVYYSEFSFQTRSKEIEKAKPYSNLKEYQENTTGYFPPVTVNVNNNPANGKIFFHNSLLSTRRGGSYTSYRIQPS